MPQRWLLEGVEWSWQREDVRFGAVSSADSICQPRTVLNGFGSETDLYSWLFEYWLQDQTLTWRGLSFGYPDIWKSCWLLLWLVLLTSKHQSS
jgi:hypothetical protein